MKIIAVFIVVLFPWLALYLENNFTLFKKIGAIVICYAAGMLLGNIGIEHGAEEILKNIVDVSIPLAIPLFIYGTDFMGWLRHSKDTVVGYTICIISAAVVCTVLGVVFHQWLPESWQVAGMLTGVYTGGTPNLTAIGHSLSASREIIIITNSMDMIAGSLFLLILLVTGRNFLKNFLVVKEVKPEDQICHHVEKNYSVKELLPGASISLALSALSFAIAVTASQLIFDGINVGFLIFVISTLGIMGSFNTKIRNLKGSFELGHYILMIFCFGIGTVSNIQDALSESFLLAGMVLLVVVIITTIHFLVAKVFKLDRDTAVITCVAGIFGPPFVPLIADRFDNKSMIVPGITTGLIGFGIGNYLGMSVAYLVKYLTGA